MYRFRFLLTEWLYLVRVTKDTKTIPGQRMVYTPKASNRHPKDQAREHRRTVQPAHLSVTAQAGSGVCWHRKPIMGTKTPSSDIFNFFGCKILSRQASGSRDLDQSSNAHSCISEESFPKQITKGTPLVVHQHMPCFRLTQIQQAHELLDIMFALLVDVL
jgi:hypothetical protein